MFLSTLQGLFLWSLPFLLATLGFVLGYRRGARGDVRNLRVLSIVALVAALLGGAAYYYAYTFACINAGANDFCALDYASLGYYLTGLGQLIGLYACGKALADAFHQQRRREIAALLVALLFLSAPIALWQIQAMIAVIGPSFPFAGQILNALTVFFIGFRFIIIQMIAPLPFALYALFFVRRMPTAPAGAAGGLA
jgi:hypothetical protein